MHSLHLWLHGPRVKAMGLEDMQRAMWDDLTNPFLPRRSMGAACGMS